MKKKIDASSIAGGLTIQYGPKDKPLKTYDKSGVDQELIDELENCNNYQINIKKHTPEEFIVLYENNCLPHIDAINKIYTLYKNRG